MCRWREYACLSPKVADRDDFIAAEAETDVLDPRICTWCINRDREICIEECAPEGKYRYLEPVALEHWEPPPPLPPFCELVDSPAYAKLAFVFLGLHYLREIETSSV